MLRLAAATRSKNLDDWPQETTFTFKGPLPQQFAQYIATRMLCACVRDIHRIF